jgi:diacylglycerol kinase (ATP)
MQNNAQLKLLFVINPVSGGNEKIILEAGIRSYFSQSVYDICLVTLNGKTDAAIIQEQINLFQPGKVIAVGGDGTIKLVAEQLRHTNMALGILPAGSANGLATELGLPFTVNEALDVITGGVIKMIDLILVNEKEICIHLSDIGLNALMVKYYSRGSFRGKWAYARVLIPVLLRRRKIKTTLQVNGETINRSAFMIVLANARAYGSGFVINPIGELGDGKFEVVIIKEISLWELFKMILTRKPFDPDKTEIIQTKEICITTKRKVFFQIDGEYRGKLTTVNARILPAAIGLILPAR